MPSPLLDIPGARTGRAARRAAAGGPARVTRPLGRAPLVRAARPEGRRWWRRLLGLLALALLVAIVAVLWWLWRGTMVSIHLAESVPSLHLRPDAATERPIRIRVEPAQLASNARVTLSGVPQLNVEHNEGDVVVRLPDGLPEAGYELAVTVSRPLPFGVTRASWPLVIDGTPPFLRAPKLAGPVPIDEPLTVSGVVEAGAVVTVDPGLGPMPELAVNGDSYALTWSHPPADEVAIVATDAAGNASTVTFAAAVTYPATRAVHVTSAGWAHDQIRNAVLEYIDAGLIDAVQLDIKDESGIVGYDSKVPLAAEIGAISRDYELEPTIADLHRRGVRVIGRIVAFRDPVLAHWAWKHGHREWVVQESDGSMLAAYGGFTNYMIPEVREYNLALAEEAARRGFDDILWDYIRRPEGDPTEMIVPRLTGTGLTTGAAMTEFLAESHRRLRPLGVHQGASVFGIAADRPDTVGQPIPAFARHNDYIAPMVYPSHYNPGEYYVADPNRQPYDIVYRSLEQFVFAVEGSGAVLVPWLQDFSMGVRYGPEEVAAQIRAAYDVGSVGFILWNAGAVYTREGLLQR